LSNRFDNLVEGTATVRSTVLNEQPLFVQLVVKLGCTTGFTTVLKEQTVHSTPLSNQFYNPVWQPAV